jgi:hypothetical protein
MTTVLLQIFPRTKEKEMGRIGKKERKKERKWSMSYGILTSTGKKTMDRGVIGY